jgi:hypothetical protein
MSDLLSRTRDSRLLLANRAIELLQLGANAANACHLNVQGSNFECGRDRTPRPGHNALGNLRRSAQLHVRVICRGD